jgi:hypothetical protein
MHIRCPHCHNPIQVVDDRPEEVVCPGYGSSFRVHDAPLPTTEEQLRRIGKFELMERVGVGGFGAVYRARDMELAGPVLLHAADLEGRTAGSHSCGRHGERTGARAGV